MHRKTALCWDSHTDRSRSPIGVSACEAPADAEREFERVLGQAFHQGCSITDGALATGLPPDRVVAVGRRTIRGTKWLRRIETDP
jgi:hypothetical protein